MKYNPHFAHKTMRLGAVTVSVQPRHKAPYTVLRVSGLVDAGAGMPTVFLTNALPQVWEVRADKIHKTSRGLVLPRRIAGLNCVYTGRRLGAVPDAHEALKLLSGNAKIAAVVPDVISPGDFVLFRHEGPKARMRFAGVVRAVRSVEV